MPRPPARRRRRRRRGPGSTILTPIARPSPRRPYARVAISERRQAFPQVATGLRRVSGQILVLDDVEHGERGGAGDRVATEGAEEFGLLRNRPEHLGPGDQGGDREAVAHRLADRDHVGLDPEGWKHHRLSRTGRDRTGPRRRSARRPRPHPPGSFSQEDRTRVEDAVAGEDRVNEEGGEAVAAGAARRRDMAAYRSVHPSSSRRWHRRDPSGAA